MEAIATNIALIAVSITGLAAATIAAGYGLFGIKHGAKWVKSLFSSTSR